MKIKVKQPVINVTRSLLNQEGYVKDFEDFYHAGKLLSEMPKAEMLNQNATIQEQQALLNKEVDEFDIDDAGVKVIKKALKFYLDAKKSPTEHHFALITAIGIDLKSSL